jgi:hypothetical protein
VSKGDKTPRRAHRFRQTAEAPGMTISGTDVDPGNRYAVAIQKIAQDQAKRDGEQVVTLIERAAPPPGPNGEGTHVNTYA